jgi:hypothetical protein
MRGAAPVRPRGLARANRQPALYRPANGEATELPTVQHGLREAIISWRLFSGLIVVSLGVVLFLFFSADAFYVHTIGVSGLRYLQKDEIFRWAEIADLHLFWIDPAQVRASIMRSPAVADAEVLLGWPPNMVLINIQEREPALIWSQAGVDLWVDLHGFVLMQPPQERADLIRVVAEGAGELLTPRDRLPGELVTGALQLAPLLGEARTLRYHPVDGLGFARPEGTEVWFGSGVDMPTKLLVYEAILADWAARGATAREINVGNPDAPFDCCLP